LNRYADKLANKVLSHTIVGDLTTNVCSKYTARSYEKLLLEALQPPLQQIEFIELSSTFC